MTKGSNLNTSSAHSGESETDEEEEDDYDGRALVALSAVIRNEECAVLLC